MAGFKSNVGKLVLEILKCEAEIEPLCSHGAAELQNHQGLPGALLRSHGHCKRQRWQILHDGQHVLQGLLRVQPGRRRDQQRCEERHLHGHGVMTDQPHAVRSQHGHHFSQELGRALDQRPGIRHPRWWSRSHANGLLRRSHRSQHLSRDSARVCLPPVNRRLAIRLVGTCGFFFVPHDSEEVCARILNCRLRHFRMQH